jgi:hypothetical protein
MAVATVKCPGCKSVLKIDPTDGPDFECDECGKRFRFSPKPASAPAAAAAPKKRPAPPPPDDDDENEEEEDEEPARRRRRRPERRVRKRSKGMPAWVLPVSGVVAALLCVVLFFVFFGKSLAEGMSRLSADAMKAVPPGAEQIIIVRPKGLAGVSGSTVGETLAGGGRHYVPEPPSGYGYEAGHMDEFLQVVADGKQMQIMRFIWKAKPDGSAPVAEEYKGFRIRTDVRKGKSERYVVASGTDLIVCSTVDACKAAIDAMTTAKEVSPDIPPKASGEHGTPAAYITRRPFSVKKQLHGDFGDDVPPAKFISAITTLKDINYWVDYTFTYDSPEAAAAAKEAWMKARSTAGKIIYDKTNEMLNNLEPGQDPFAHIKKNFTPELSVDGSSIKFKVTFSKLPSLQSQLLVSHCFAVGGDFDAPGGFLNLPGAN